MAFPLHSNEAGSDMSPPPLPPVDPPSSSPPQIPPSENPLSSSAPLLPAAAQTSQPRSPPSEEPPPASDTPLPDVVPPSSPRSQPLLPPSDPQPAPSIAVDTTETIMITASVPETPMADSSNPSWFTPKRLLLIFCVINMLNYVDRGAIASNGVNGTRRTCTNGLCTKGSGIQGAFNLNNFEDGLLSSAFMVGLLVASPIFASLSKTHKPFRLIGVGLSVWTFATAGCGCSFNFWSILIFRMLVGVGEASFISLAAPFIDDNAPPAQRTTWLGLFYMCIPAGVALGYVYGGVVGGNTNWRVAFWIEAGLMLPFVIIGFLIKPLQLKGFFPSSKSSLMPSSQETPVIIQDAHEPKTGGDIQNGSDASRSREPPMLNTASNGGNQIKRFFCDLKVLLLDKVYVVNVLGYISYNFVIGAYSYWGPKAGYAIYKMSNADMFFGGITIVCGILGTLAGGYILDYIQSTISNAFKLLSSATFVGAIFCVGAFLSPKLFGFVILFAVGELLVFATQAPVNYICLHCVKPSLRPLSMAMSTVAIHIFGDVPSSPLVGLLQDRLNNWRETALILSSILFVAALVWLAGVFLHSVDRFNEEDDLTDVNTRERSRHGRVES